MNLVSRWPTIVLDGYSSKKTDVVENFSWIIDCSAQGCPYILEQATPILLLYQLSRCLKTYSTSIITTYKKYYFNDSPPPCYFLKTGKKIAAQEISYVLGKKKLHAFLETKCYKKKTR